MHSISSNVPRGIKAACGLSSASSITLTLPSRLGDARSAIPTCKYGTTLSALRLLHTIKYRQASFTQQPPSLSILPKFRLDAPQSRISRLPIFLQARQQLPHHHHPLNHRRAYATGPPPRWPYEPVSPYQILNLPKTATAKEIKAKYYELSFQHHPDKNLHLPDPQKAAQNETYIRIQKAYDLLSDPLSRKEYDMGTYNLQTPTSTYNPTGAPEGSAYYATTSSGGPGGAVTTPYEDFKIVIPWFYALFFFLTLFYFFSSYLRSRREREMELAWMDWIEQRKEDGLEGIGVEGFYQAKGRRSKPHNLMWVSSSGLKHHPNKRGPAECGNTYSQEYVRRGFPASK
ncbi:hypothetical protein HDV05_008221 [Chytridiales sp. JEL 0842]|nr:hypothetical protein HDV05_008221 [Chytridiales sp. JEL 0842]